MLPVVLTDIGLVTAVTGAISLVRPLTFLGITSRALAAAVLASGLILFAIALSLPAMETRVESSRHILDRVSPVYQFHEFHSATFHASPERLYDAIKAITADEIFLFRRLIAIRNFGRLPADVAALPQNLPLLEIATRTSFVTLADTPSEIVVGTVVHVPPERRGWRPRTPDEFLALRDRPGFALATMNYLIEPVGGGASVVSTETRVYATDAPARRQFASYWRIIYPGSALIRRMWLRALRKRVEAG
jgi:hypothetical protein